MTHLDLHTEAFLWALLAAVLLDLVKALVLHQRRRPPKGPPRLQAPRWRAIVRRLGAGSVMARSSLDFLGDLGPPW